MNRITESAWIQIKEAILFSDIRSAVVVLSDIFSTFVWVELQVNVTDRAVKLRVKMLLMDNIAGVLQIYK